MSLDYINMAFKKLDALDEELFNFDNSGFADFTDFIDGDAAEEETVSVIDPSANTEEDLQSSYVGKVILNCNVCHSNIFEDKEEVVIDADTGIVNAEMNCPYCNESEGFMIVGEIVPFNTDTQEDTPIEEPSDEDTPIEEPNEEDNTSLEESIETTPLTNREKLLRAFPELNFDNTTSLTEDFKDVTVTTEDQRMEMHSEENGKVTITTEPIEQPVAEDKAEKIAPVSDETVDELMSANDLNTDDEFTDVDFDDFDEEDFNELGESYLKEVYENIESFKTTDVLTNNNNLIVEGVIKFTSGAKKRTGFVFEAKEMTSDGELLFEGHNNHLSESKDAFMLSAKLDNKKLFLESLNYNYKIDNKSVKGSVSKK